MRVLCFRCGVLRELLVAPPVIGGSLSWKLRASRRADGSLDSADRDEVEEEAEEPAPDTPVKGFEPEEEDGGEAVARESDAGFEEVEEDTPENGLEAALLVPDDKPLNGLLAAALALLEDAAPPNGLLDDDLAGLAPNTSTVEEEAPRGPASLDFLVEVAEP